ncbi:MAG: magnesium/cobalt transporter CorA [Calditrichia bacterium]
MQLKIPLKNGSNLFINKFMRKRSKKTGLPPGSMVHVGEKKVEQVKLSVIDYDQDNIKKRDLKNVEEAFPFKDTPTVSWLNLTGLHDIEILEKIGTRYNIHPLILEDILNTDQRPKVEITDNYIFIVLKMLSYDPEKHEINAEQVSLIMGENYVITFQEREGDVFNPLRERIENGKGRIRKSGPDYLTYAIIDIIIDNYFLVLELIGEQIEYLEGNVLENPDHTLVQRIQRMKRELIFLRKSTWPLREVISGITRDETSLITEATHPYLRDLYDHTVQVIDTVETFRDMVSGILDIYLSSVSNRMNEVMKVLTIIATIFIPLTFLAGIYGMNFEYMPELKWHWSYPVLWLVMIGIFIGMLFYFRRKKWI